MSWVSDLPKDYLECRDLRHPWKVGAFRSVPLDELEIKVPLGYYQVIRRDLTCQRCGATRIEHFGRSNQHNLLDFDKFNVSYKYPKGYVYVTKEHDEPRPRYRDFVYESFNRQIRR